MHRSRRAVLVGVPVALAGCGRSFRANTVPGGLHLRNRRNGAVTVSVRAALLPERGTSGGGVGGTTVTETPTTPRDADLEDPGAAGEYTVGAEEERAVPDFFPQRGRWAFEAVAESDDEENGDRTRIELYAAIPGPTGADTVVVRIEPDGVSAETTTVDD